MAKAPELVLAVALLLGVFATVLAGDYLLLATKSYLSRAHSRRRLANNERALSSLKLTLRDDLYRNGISLLRYPATALLRISSFRDLCTNVTGWLNFCSKTNQSVVSATAELLLASSLGALLVTQILFAQPLLSLLAGAFLVLCIKQKVETWRQKQRSNLREQLPDALTAIGMCFNAGYSLQQALFQTAQECSEPLASELAQTADDIHAGCSINEALAALERRTELPDIRFVTTALEIQHSTGGSLRDILESAADSITASFEMSRSLEVQTAQARMSARIVSIMPVVLACVLSLAMDGYLASFFSSGEGFAILCFAVLLEAIGIAIIRRILAIELE